MIRHIWITPSSRKWHLFGLMNFNVFIILVYFTLRHLIKSLKGIVHPKMKILSFTHSQVVSNPVWMSLFCWTQRKIFWRKFVIRLFWGTIDFHSRKKNKKHYGSQWCPRTALFPTFFRISSFVFSRTKTFIQVWNYLRVSKWWQNFHFWVNYPFKSKNLAYSDGLVSPV